MIRLFSSRTGQELGGVHLTDGSVALDPTSMRRVMETLAASDIGHLVVFSFGQAVTPAECLFGGKVAQELDISRRDAPSSDFSPL